MSSAEGDIEEEWAVVGAPAKPRRLAPQTTMQKPDFIATTAPTNVGHASEVSPGGLVMGSGDRNNHDIKSHSTFNNTAYDEDLKRKVIRWSRDELLHYRPSSNSIGTTAGTDTTDVGEILPSMKVRASLLCSLLCAAPE